MSEFKTGWYPGTTNDDHHQGKFKPYIGSSMLKTAINQSFAHLHYEQTHPKLDTPAFMFGDRFHSYALEYEMGDMVVVPKVDKRTKAGKALAAELEIKYADKRMVSQPDYDKMKGMVRALHRHPYVGKLMQTKERELTGIWYDVNNKLPCKIRPDLITHEQRIIIDLKSCVSAAEVDANRDIFKFGYDISAAWYKWGAREITGHDYNFIDVFVEKTPPHGITWFPMGGLTVRKAWERIGEVLGDLSDCIINDKWPSYDIGPCEPNPPSWRL